LRFQKIFDFQWDLFSFGKKFHFFYRWTNPCKCGHKICSNVWRKKKSSCIFNWSSKYYIRLHWLNQTGVKIKITNPDVYWRAREKQDAVLSFIRSIKVQILELEPYRSVTKPHFFAIHVYRLFHYSHSSFRYYKMNFKNLNIEDDDTKL